MPIGLLALAALALPLVVAYALTPVAIRVAGRLNFYDKPAGYKGHGRPTPYLGGAAVMVGFLLAVVAAWTDDRGRALPLLGGMALLWVVGTVDDRRNLSWATRVAVEVALGTMLWAAGLGWDLG